MKSIELKFLLKLVGHPGYRASITQLKPNEKTSASERDKTCRELRDRGIVGYSREVVRFKIDPSAKGLLKQDAAAVPLTEQHLAILEASKEKTITPGQISSKKVPASERQNIIQDLEAKGFVKVEKDQIKEVWLTERGKEFLREECVVSGGATISLNLLQNYINFLRKEAHRMPPSVDTSSGDQDIQEAPNESEPLYSDPLTFSGKPSDAEILQTIRNLDQELGTENYLPIFHLRKKLQPPLSREELDQALYRLQMDDKIDMSSLVDAVHYTSEEIQAGIPQDLGSPLFFIMLNDESAENDSLIAELV